MRELGIYVHIPFCIKKCKYCDFISFDNILEKSQIYCKSLIDTIENVEIIFPKLNISVNEFKENFIINTIYFGGGTPSSIDSDLIIEILKTIKKKFKVANNCEITIEINPGTVNEQKLKNYKDAGFNRISIGLQETHNNILNLIGRIHTYEQFVESFKMARKIGFENINIDLMLGLPNQTLENLEESINRVIELKPNHISLYSLILESGTDLEKSVNAGKLLLPQEDLERKMYHKTKIILEKNGFSHYEISNFAKKGFESKHNLNCWDQKEYLGFGISAHSYLEKIRFSNISDLDRYLLNIKNSKFEDNIEINEIQNHEDILKEYMMLGFRKLDGVKISEFEYKFRINPLFYFRFEISKLEEEGLIEVDLDNIKLTKKGLDLANLVFEEFV
ncbi:MAG: radical SAM family heme chaperone HemW [Clostridia bacterium]|nr:radical SAM family heme chaperone HemW [Clostridia bacterium]